MVDCGHHHEHETANSRKLIWALAIIVVFMVVEVVGGVLSGSLALLADATHMLTDAFALGLAASAQVLARRPANFRLHFGYRRAQVLAAFVNGVLMAVLLFWIVTEAVARFINPVEVDASLMLWIAVAGFVANLAAFYVLHRPKENDLNMRGALLHVVGDLMGSVAAIIAAVVIMTTGWSRIDPILSVIVAILIGVSAWRLIRETSHILLEGAPADVSREELAEGLKIASPLIRDVHQVQIWQLTPDMPRLTMHVCVDREEDAQPALALAKRFLEEKYDIRHSTIQIEIAGDCPDRAYIEAATNAPPAATKPAASPARAEAGATPVSAALIGE